MTSTAESLLFDKPEPLVTHAGAQLAGAVNVMLENGYSQLPVVDDRGTVHGIITSESIIEALANFGCGLAQLRTRDAQIQAKLVRPEDDVFDVLKELESQNAVLVVDADRKLLGIITTYDTTVFFREQSEDRMLIEDIENSIRDQICWAHSNGEGELDQEALSQTVMRVCPDEATQNRGRFIHALQHYLDAMGIESDGLDDAIVDESLAKLFGTPGAAEFDDLTLYQYCGLLLDDAVWNVHLAGTGMHQETVREWLDDIRTIRNEMFHFRSSELEGARNRLRFAARWFNNNEPGHVTDLPVVSDETVQMYDTGRDLETPVMSAGGGDDQLELIPAEEESDPTESRYAGLGRWLGNNPAPEDKIRLSFTQVERIIDGALPPSARKHRAWWANAPEGHSHAEVWLEAGWRVSSVSISQEHVTFMRLRKSEEENIRFYDKLYSRLAQHPEFPVKVSSPAGANWFVVARLPLEGKQKAVLGYSFIRKGRFRVELYIDSGSRERNKRAFERLRTCQAEIEERFGEPLSWERMDNARASRIAYYWGSRVESGDRDDPRLMEWAVEMMVRFYEAIWEIAYPIIESC